MLKQVFADGSGGAWLPEAVAVNVMGLDREDGLACGRSVLGRTTPLKDYATV